MKSLGGEQDAAFRVLGVLGQSIDLLTVPVSAIAPLRTRAS